MSERSQREIIRAVGRALREVRESTGMNLTRFAPMVGLAQQALSERELGHTPPTFAEVARIETAAGFALGTVYVRSGLVSPEWDTRAVLLADPELGDDRGMVVGMYDLIVRVKAAQGSDDPGR